MWVSVSLIPPESGKDYYRVSDYVLSINETRKACVCIKIKEDDKLEGLEAFEATIERNSALPNVVNLTDTKASVTIQDMAGSKFPCTIILYIPNLPGHYISVYTHNSNYSCNIAVSYYCNKLRCAL